MTRISVLVLCFLFGNVELYAQALSVNLKEIIEEEYTVLEWMSPTCAAIQVQENFCEKTKWKVLPLNSNTCAGVLYLKMDTLLYESPTHAYLVMGVYNSWDSLRNVAFVEREGLCFLGIYGAHEISIEPKGIVETHFSKTTSKWQKVNAIPVGDWLNLNEIGDISLIHLPNDGFYLKIKEKNVLAPLHVIQEKTILLQPDFPYVPHFSFVSAEYLNGESQSKIYRSLYTVNWEEYQNLMETSFQIQKYRPPLLQKTFVVCRNRTKIRETLFVFDGTEYVDISNVSFLYHKNPFKKSSYWQDFVAQVYYPKFPKNKKKWQLTPIVER